MKVRNQNYKIFEINNIGKGNSILHKYVELFPLSTELKATLSKPKMT